MSRLPISICIIAKNEEKNIERNLINLVKYDAEIIVVDTGSTDNTKEIAKKYTNRVYDFEWINDFSAARNFAASKATNNWILALDCDECVMDIDTRMLRVYMQQHLRHVGMLELKNWTNKEDGTKIYSLDQVPRFYNKNFFEYRFKIHEQITPKNVEDLSTVTLMTYKLPIVAEHYGYDLTPDKMYEKQIRNLELLNDAIGETPFDDYIFFQIGQSYSILHQYDHAAEAYLQCIQINDNFEKYFMKIAVIAYAQVLHTLERYDEEIELLLNVEGHMQTAMFYYTLGKAFQSIGDPLKALLTFVKVTTMSDFDSLGEDAYDVFLRIMNLHSMSGNTEGLVHFKNRMAEYGSLHGREIIFN